MGGGAEVGGKDNRIGLLLGCRDELGEIPVLGVFGDSDGQADFAGSRDRYERFGAVDDLARVFGGD